ncbi:hypothetical protein AUC68_09635 [Methyloceanibacter methanicus]|uniref:Uncharacterized protein n=1 Tax=Methyloceanibacter methanicus TaxID=1774968 RepID=A0A1E3VYM1_9HYPH|nr:hypothetical protein AUC68_09635 [Methyloceanibacter methanicus]
MAGAGLMGTQADAAISLAVALKNYYAEYEIVQQCARQAQLSVEDVETAGAAMAAIEKYYFGRDDGLNKAHLKKQAIADKNDSFKILERSGESGFRPYCQMSMNELLRKAKEVEAPAGAQ